MREMIPTTQIPILHAKKCSEKRYIVKLLYYYLDKIISYTLFSIESMLKRRKKQ